MDNKIEKAKELIFPLLKEENYVLDRMRYYRKEKENYLEIFVEREDYSPISLDEIVALSEKISQALDKDDPFPENYILDVSTSGAEKEIHDFSRLPLLKGKKMEVHLKNPYKGENIYIGFLKEVTSEQFILTYRVKARVLEATFDITNVSKIKLAV